MYLSCLLFNRSKRPENFEVPGAHALEDPFAVQALGGPVEASEDPGTHTVEDPIAVPDLGGPVEASGDTGAHALEDPLDVPTVEGPVDASEDPLVTSELDATGLVPLHASDTTVISFGALLSGSTIV